MRRRLALAVITGLMLTVTLSAGVASGATGTLGATATLVVGDAGADGEIGAGFFPMDPLCVTGSNDTDRVAMEFPLAGLPGNAKIISAVWSVSAANGVDPTGQTALYVYPGNGVLADADAMVSGTPILFTPPPSGYHPLDVTAQLTPAVRTAGWIGFSIRQDPPNAGVDHWVCPHSGGNTPFLTIQYQLPLTAGVVFGGTSTGGGPFTANGLCYSGRGLGQEVRCAFEFDISGIPAGATVTSAVLSTRGIPVGTGCSVFGCQTDFAGYAGNGVGEVEDLTAGSVLFTYQPSFFSHDDHDVTAFIAATYAGSGDWAGFRASPAGGGFNGAADWTSSAGGPLLFIEYTLPTATSLPDAATMEPTPVQPVVVVAVGMILIAALGSVAVVSARRSR